MDAPSPIRRAIAWGMILGLGAAVLLAGGVLYVGRSARSGQRAAGPLTLVVLAGRGGQEGAQVAMLVGVLDTTSGRPVVHLVDPDLKVTLPGTSYERLSDAYPFGGGAGVAAAYAGARGGQPLPWVVLTEPGWTGVVDAVGGVSVEVPETVNVFDGTKLYSFAPGRHTLSGAETAALLSGADFLGSSGAKARLRERVATALVAAVVERRPSLRGRVAGGQLLTSLLPDELDKLGGTLAVRLEETTVTARP